MREFCWNRCTEEELWLHVASHLKAAGIETVFVGGAVVAVYSRGLYRSGDLDLIPDDTLRKELAASMAELGFTESGRHFRHPECPHLFVEFPPGPVAIGSEYPITPSTRNFGGQRLSILSPTDCVKDRLAAYIHWGARDCFDQAILVCTEQKSSIDWDSIGSWCDGEGAKGPAAFAELKEAMGQLPPTP